MRVLKKYSVVFILSIVGLAGCSDSKNDERIRELNKSLTDYADSIIQQDKKIRQLEDKISKLEDEKMALINESLKMKGTVGKSGSSTSTETNNTRDSQQKQVEKGLGNILSRSDFPSVLSGTTWVSNDQKIKLAFNGNKVTLYYSKPRRNYDDPVEWYNPGPDPTINYPETKLLFYLIEEPRKGLYKIQYREDRAGRGAIINLEVRGNQLYYADLQGSEYKNKFYPMKRIN